MNNEEDYRDGYTPDIIQSFLDVRDILDNRIGTVYAMEAPLYSNHLGVAGRVDCIAEFDGKLSVIDFKTSMKPKKLDWIKNYFMQESAYAIMWEERTGQPITQLVTIISVDDHEPQVFIEHRDNWVRPLRDTIKQYEEEKFYCLICINSVIILKFNLGLQMAYDIIPTSTDAIDKIKHLDNAQKEKLKGLYQDSKDPLALSSKPSEKGIKIVRTKAVDLNLPNLSKKYGFKLTAGNGSRGGTGSKSQGFAFEHQIVKDLELYKAEGITADFKFPNMIKKMHDEFLKDAKNIIVKLDGGANTKRPLVFGDAKAVIGSRDLKIGDKVTDVTVITNEGKYYLSAKFGGTVTFFNAGVRTILKVKSSKQVRSKTKTVRNYWICLVLKRIESLISSTSMIQRPQTNVERKSEFVLVMQTSLHFNVYYLQVLDMVTGWYTVKVRK